MSRTDSRAPPASHTSSQTSAMSTSRNNSLRREGSGRRSLRSMRCQSVVITEKEKTLLIKQSDKKASSHEAKVASKGFVRSMCKFYSDIIGGSGDQGYRPRRSVLDRSHSFGAVKEVKDLSLESISEKGSSEQCLASPVSSRSGSFRLNRSRSWRGERLESYSEAETPKRNSPTGQSVRSQDSGFSDSGENAPDIESSYESQSSSGPTSSGEEAACDQQKSFVTKINIDTEVAESHQGKHNQNNFLCRLPISENYQANCARTGTTPVARQKVNGSLDNIVSLQEGFKIKLESEARSLYNQGCDANVDHFPSAANNKTPHQGLLLRARPRPQTEAGGHHDLNPLSPSTAACPRFSTPVRASFRRRPQTMICVDEAHTPVVKRESRTRLKEIKSRRRWSNIDQDQSKLSPLSVNTTLNIKNSGSQYSRNNLNAESCYEFRNQHERRNSNLSPSLTALSLISPVGDTSLQADGTGTRLMVDSYRDQTTAMARSNNTIFPNESVLAGLHSDTIIEHESCSSAPAPVQVCSAAVGQGLQDQTRPGDSSGSVR